MGRWHLAAGNLLLVVGLLLAALRVGSQPSRAQDSGPSARPPTVDELRAMRDDHLWQNGRTYYPDLRRPRPPAYPLPLPSPEACIDEICRQVGQLGCDDQSEILRVARLCSVQPSGDCIAAACNQLGRLQCDSLDDIVPIARACRTNFSGDCLRLACRYAGAFVCDDQRAVTRLLATCSGNVSGACVRSVCGRLGAFGCDDLDEISRVARVCAEIY